MKCGGPRGIKCFAQDHTIHTKKAENKKDHQRPRSSISGSLSTFSSAVFIAAERKCDQEEGVFETERGLGAETGQLCWLRRCRLAKLPVAPGQREGDDKTAKACPGKG